MITLVKRKFFPSLLCLMLFLLSWQTIVYAVLEISIDKQPLAFGFMQLGEEKELNQYGGYHQEIVCSSTDGNTWYLKINLLKPLSSGQDAIPLENFKWQLVYSSGKGRIANLYEYKEFSLFPDLVYISASDENAGESISLQFKYLLEIPEVQTAGSYNTVIRFTLTEVL